VTTPRRKPAQPAPAWPTARPYIPHPLSKEDLLELSGPSDYPKYPDRWLPEYPGPDELPDTVRTRDPQPDREAEP
jgi:hypothetical protein